MSAVRSWLLLLVIVERILLCGEFGRITSLVLLTPFIWVRPG